MKHLIVVLGVFLCVSGIFGCSQKDNSKVLEQYKYEESEVIPNEISGKKLESWVKAGANCFGIVVVLDENEKPIRVKEINARIIRVEPDKIKMRSLETIMRSAVKGCNRYGIREGEDWDEKDGDVFLTREEAIKYIDEKYPGLRMQ